MAQGRGEVTVNHATATDYAFQLIGNNTIGTINYGGSADDKAQRQFQAVLRWLSPSDEAIKLQHSIHDESRSNHKLEDTGLWFLDDGKFSGWLEGTSRLTWVNGGSEYSNLCSFTGQDKLMQRSQWVVEKLSSSS
jgi:hypothetical protein